MNSSLVTIIVLSYNHGQFLEEAIEAVYAQTYKNIQLIVTDDFSRDNSADIIKALQQRHQFETVINTVNKGMNATLAQALSLAKGEYVSIISADDYMLADKTSIQLQYLHKSGKHGVYATGYSLTANKKELIKLNPVFEHQNSEAILPYIYQHDWGAPLLQSGMFKKEVFDQTLPLRFDFKSDDWAFLIRVYEEFDIGFINQPVFCYRQHDDNTFKKYWFTFPMRVDVVSRLVPEKYRQKAAANILFSQGTYIMQSSSYFQGLRMQLAALLMNFSWENLKFFFRSNGAFVKNKIKGAR